MNARDAFKVRPLAEADLDFALTESGGIRAHADADRRADIGADYRLGSALIELKALDEEGFEKPPRQQKLATLFRKYDSERPVVVLDPRRLNDQDKNVFNRIIEGPIKTSVTKANRQLKRSRVEHDDATRSVLMVVNNGYTTLDHDALKTLVAHRVRQDTHEIDAVVVAGAYYYSDGFDGVFLWPIDCIPICLERPFVEFEQLRAGWNALANRFMTQMIRGELDPVPTKDPVADVQFDVNGVTYIRPAPIMGVASDFYVHGRPRKDSSGIVSCPPVGLVLPALSRVEWTRLAETVAHPSEMLGSYEAWKHHEAQGYKEGNRLQPFVTVKIAMDEWDLWRSNEQSNKSILDFTNECFGRRVRELVGCARNLDNINIVPSHYTIAITEIIDQDSANDVSHIFIIREMINGENIGHNIVKNARISHEHALALAAAYAVREGIEAVMWAKDMEYAWI